MKIKKMFNNKICDPSMPRDAEDKATRCLVVLLRGGVVNRHTQNEKLKAITKKLNALVGSGQKQER